MKIRLYIIGLLSVIIFLAWLYLPLVWQNTPRIPVTTSSPPPETSSSKAASPARSAQPKSMISSTGKPYTKEQLHEIMTSANQPISFFGKVIDQDGNPIPDVKVTFQIRYMKEVGSIGIGDTFDYPSVTTGSDGCFAITGAKGSVLAVKSLEKSGYEPSEHATRGTYWYWRDQDPYRPDADAPQIFRMWKQAGAEYLIRKSFVFHLKYDGTPTSFDLMTGKQKPDGDIRISVKRNPRELQYGHKNYEWNLKIEILTGGMIETDADQMYLAPTSGYQREIIFHMPANSTEWSNVKESKVYLNFDNYKYYGRGHFRFRSMYDDSYPNFVMNFFINPSGSRNLEYDPLQNVEKNVQP
ncbi:carboxypeptidase regulatory-like domain-containing protein [Opitutaceae bacterium TAV4]|nr:carboxypeptidase regulatory-like domain-containing protein [Opitutaceae bacterium TAV4]RRK00361.1 carboxypeptidase regulatory-like domain-containing protein [Opitutaceae bacterium TAV3]